MRNSHKILLAAVAFMLAAMRPDFATFIPQVVKVALAGILLLVGFYMMYQDRKW